LVEPRSKELRRRSALTSGAHIGQQDGLRGAALSRRLVRKYDVIYQ
jgi:hypothetical protein